MTLKELQKELEEIRPVVQAAKLKVRALNERIYNEGNDDEYPGELYIGQAVEDLDNAVAQIDNAIGDMELAIEDEDAEKAAPAVHAGCTPGDLPGFPCKGCGMFH